MMGRTTSKRADIPRKKSLSLPSRHRGVDRVGQGHVKQHQYYKRDPGFLVIQIQAHFHFRPDWYRQGEVCALVKQYYVVLRSVLRSRPICGAV